METEIRKPVKTGKAALLWRFLKGSKYFFAVSILTAMCVSVLQMLIPQIVRVTIDSILDDRPAALPSFIKDAVTAAGGPDYFRTHLYWVAALITAIGLLLTAFQYLTRVYNARGGETLVQVMRNMLFGHIQRLPFSWHMEHQTGDLIQRCTSDVETVRNFLSGQLTSVFRIILLLGFSLYFMFGINVHLAGVISAFIPVIVIYSIYFGRRIHDRFMQCDVNEAALSTIAQENFTGIRVVRAFGRENYERERFEKQNTKYTHMWVSLNRYLTLFWGAGDITSGLQVLTAVASGSVLCTRGDMTAGGFVAFISYNAMLIWPVRRLGRILAEMSKAGVSIERIRAIMDSPVEKDRPGALEPDMNGDISFEHVTFGYGGEPPVLDDVTFTVPHGTVFGILGGTGSGKTTLMHLLDRLYELPPENGRISIGGVDIADIKAGWLRSHIGMVLQEPFLFSRTISENIGIAARGASIAEIRKAAGIACLDESVVGFSKGYDTVVGERGVTLSGGQKQRAAIARMLMQKAPVMVFDDSLSAVDAETDAKIRRALKDSFGTATVFLISHRITTLMQADRILVLEKGRCAELGTHKELLEKGGLYRQIYDMQMTLPDELKKGAM